MIRQDMAYKSEFYISFERRALEHDLISGALIASVRQQITQQRCSGLRMQENGPVLTEERHAFII